MAFLTNKWVRIFVSLFGGALFSEWLFISIGEQNKPMIGGLDPIMIISAIILYYLLTFIVKNKNKNLS
ncbi:MAG: hypothetical protein JWP12_2398 [Bacteroidetes bacterium]|nr:hypothetical protein [Bacteroidota bacterium]